MKKKCYIANYEHVGKVCWGSQKMRRLFCDEEVRLRKYHSIKYGWDNEAYTYDNLAEEDPELLQIMKDMLKEYPGRIQIGASSYGQPLSYYINGESNVRQLTEGIRTDLEHFGVRPWIYIMSEQGMHAQIPQLIAQAGFRGAVMRTSFCMYGTNPEFPASCILWRGLDGEMAVPTVPTYPGEQCHCAVNGYTHDRRTLEFTLFGANTMDNKILLDYPADAPWGDLTEFCERFGGRIKNLIAFRADDPRQQEALVAKYDKCDEFPWVLDTEILDAAGEPELDVQTSINDFHVRMPWGLCGNWIWEKCRKFESRLYTLELLDALRTVAGRHAHEEDLRDAWKMLLISQHHDVQIVGLEKDARKFFARGEEKLQRIEADVLATESPYLFNPLPWCREDAQRQNPFSVNEGVFSNQCRSRLKENVLSTPFYTAKLCDYGGFSSMWDKNANREIFLSDRRSGILAGNISGIPCVAEGQWSAKAGNSCMVLTDTGRVGEIPYSVQWTFYDDHPRVDIQITVEMNRQYVGRRSNDTKDTFSAFQHEEKLRLKFYPNLSDDSMGWHDQPFGVTASNRQSLECNYWAALSDGTNGFAVFNQGVQCAVREIDGALSLPVAFSMYYVWDNTKNLRAYQDEATWNRQSGCCADKSDAKYFLNGIYHTHFAIYPFQGTWEQAQLHRRALEYSHPCVPISREMAKLIETQKIELKLSENMFVSTVYQKNAAIYFRVYEMEGKNGSISAQMREKLLPLEPVDFFETPVGKVCEEQTIKPHQVKTFRMDASLCPAKYKENRNETQ